MRDIAPGAWGSRVVAMGMAVVAAGCTAIAGIEEGVLVQDASTDATTDHAAPAESGAHDAGGPADATSPEGGADADAGAAADATLDATTPGDAQADAPTDARPPSDAPAVDSGSDVVSPPPCMPAMPGQACCTTSAQPCVTGYACHSGTCTAAASDVGQSCTVSQHCQAFDCLPSGRCTVACTAATDCPPSWSCPVQGSGPQVCVCDKTNNGVEACDGVDNDCNGKVDDGANAACATSGTGTLSQCYELDAGAAACACPTTSNQCSNDPCADLQNDGNNCGRCGHYCQYPLGFGCEGGTCQAFTWVDPAAIDAGNTGSIGGIAVDPMYVYFSVSQASGLTSIMRCFAGAADVCIGLETIAEGISGNAGPIFVDVASETLVGTTQQDVTGATTNPGVAFYIANLMTTGIHAVVTEGTAGSGVAQFGPVVSDGTTAAWLSFGRSGVDTEPAGTTGPLFGLPTYSSDPNYPFGLVVIPSQHIVYFGLSLNGLGGVGQLWSCALPGCTNATLVLDGASTFGSPQQMVTDGASLYFTAQGLGGAAGGVFAYSLSGHALTKLATVQNPQQIALDANGRVYWMNYSTPTIYWCPTSGCPAFPAPPNAIPVDSMAQNAFNTLDGVIVADRSSLYWNALTANGAPIIRRVELP